MYEGLYLAYSGGAANTNPNASLGGAVSTAVPGKHFSPQLITPTGSIAGVSLCVSRGNPTGDGFLVWNAKTRVMTWIPYGTANTYSASGPGLTLMLTLVQNKDTFPVVRYPQTIPAVSGYYEFGTTQWLLVYIDHTALPATTQTLPVNIAANPNNLFDNVNLTENTSGDTEYRCIWVVNNFSSQVDKLTLDVASQPTYCTIALANDFIASSDQPIQSESEAIPLVDDDLAFFWDGPGVLSTETVSIGMNGARRMAMPVLAVGMQSSNGTTGDVPVQISNENNSLSQLPSMTWGSTVDFQKPLLSGNMVSVWVRRVKTAGVVPATDESFTLRITYEGG